MKPSFDAQVRSAIEHRRLVSLRYNDRERIVEPHDYGIQKGLVRLLVYQLRSSGGSTPSGKGWRLLDAAKIDGFSLLEETFAGSRGQFHDDHLVWDELWARVR